MNLTEGGGTGVAGGMVSEFVHVEIPFESSYYVRGGSRLRQANTRTQGYLMGYRRKHHLALSEEYGVEHVRQWMPDAVKLVEFETLRIWSLGAITKNGSAQEFDEVPNWRGFQDFGFPREVAGFVMAGCLRRTTRRRGETRTRSPLKASSPGHRRSRGFAGNPSFYES
jgi:hypothetical protein